MFKKIKQYAQSKGLTVNEKAGLVYGKINGFFLTIKQDPKVGAHHVIQFGVKSGERDATPVIADFLNQFTTNNKCLKNASYSGNKIVAEFEGRGRGWQKKYTPCIEAFLEELTALCGNLGMVSGCEACGNEYGVNVYQVEGIPQTLCSSCYANMTEQIRQEVDKKLGGKGSNIIGGIVGALFGSLIGVAVWVVVYQLGYLCAIAGAIMVVCALHGYRILGRKLDTKGVIISCIICIGMVWISEQTCIAIEIYKVYDGMYGVSFFDVFQSVPDFLEMSEIRGTVIYDLVVGYILMVAGAFTTVWQAIKESRGIVNTSMVATVTSADERSGQWMQ